MGLGTYIICANSNLTPEVINQFRDWLTYTTRGLAKTGLFFKSPDYIKTDRLLLT